MERRRRVDDKDETQRCLEGGQERQQRQPREESGPVPNSAPETRGDAEAKMNDDWVP